MLYILAPKYLYRDYSEAKVYGISVHGPSTIILTIRLQQLQVMFENCCQNSEGPSGDIV